VQSQIRLSAAAVPRTDPAYPAHQLANLVYGGYFSSRLVENIREDKGYTYSARSSLEFWPEAAAVTVAFDTTTPSTAPALLEARYELGRISLLSPTPAEVDSARNYALGTLATSLATQAGLASTLASLAGIGLDETWLREHPVNLAAVTVDDVAQAAASMLAPARFTGVVVGDIGVLESELRGLGNVSLA
jgi:predicted Zn-dependent peptidase